MGDKKLTVYSQHEMENINDTINASEDLFEKNIVYLSAGALAVSFGFLEKLVKIHCANYKPTLYASWGLLILALCINLFSHLISTRNSLKAREEMNNELDYDTLIERIRLRNNVIIALNWVSAVLLVLGISLLFIFVMINI